MWAVSFTFYPLIYHIFSSYAIWNFSVNWLCPLFSKQYLLSDCPFKKSIYKLLIRIHYCLSRQDQDFLFLLYQFVLDWLLGWLAYVCLFLNGHLQVRISRRCWERQVRILVLEMSLCLRKEWYHEKKKIHGIMKHIMKNSLTTGWGSKEGES